MLTKFRTHHIKRILWALIAIIVPAFVLWGGLSYLKGDKKDVVAEIENRKITRSILNNYRKMAQLHFRLIIPQEEQYKITPQTITNQAWQFLLLLWKAEKEKVTVSDQEVVNLINERFSRNGRFDNDAYVRFLHYGFRIKPRTFEEYLRNFMVVDKLLDQYIQIDITDQDLREAFRKGTQEAKISYVFIPYEKFKEDINITPQEIEEFYNEHKTL
ncbi:MAG: SurA N-terminal domain-containing protein, partial [Candidatus Omnitrophota bacterium]